MRLSKLTFLGLACAVPLAVWGEPNGGKPGGGPGSRANGGPGGGGERPQHVKPEGWSAADREQFKKDLAEFCKENSPNRWKEVNKTPGKEGDRRIGAMAMRFGMLQSTKQQDAKLYDIKVNEIRVEDQEFGLLQALAEPNDAEKNPSKLTVEELQGQLRDTARKYVKLRLDERRHRIDKLDEMMKNEKREFQSDEGSADRLVDERYDALIKQGPSLFPFPGPRRGDDGRREGGRQPATINAAPVKGAP